MFLLKKMSVSLVLAAGLSLMAHVAVSSAQAPAGQKKEEAVDKSDLGRPDWNKTKLSFEMRGKPWSAVFEWFSDQTKMPFASQYPAPTGTFNFINPKDKDGLPKKYTLTEIYDTVNEFLQVQHKFTLLRLDSTLTMVPADADIPKTLIRRVNIEGLKDCSRTEIVEIMTGPLPGGLSADEFAPEAKRMLGAFGLVTPLAVSNQLMMQADVKSLRLVLEILSKIKDEPESVGVHRYVHKCVYVRASAAEAVLTKSLGAQTVEIRVGGGPAAPVVAEEPQGGGKGPKGGGGGNPFGFGGGGGGKETTRRTKPHTVAFDEGTNIIFVTGPADKIDLAKGIIKDLDKPVDPDQKALLIGRPDFKYHEVRRGDSESLAKMLRDHFKSLPSVRIETSGANRLFVYGDPQTHLDINRILNADVPVELKTEQIFLGRLDAGGFAESLKAMFPGGSPYIEADKEANSVRVRGTDDQIKTIKEVVKALDDVAGSTSTQRVITLEKGSGATVAEAIELLFPRLRENPIKVVLPGNVGARPEPKFEKLPPPGEPKKMSPTKEKGAFNQGPAPLNKLDLRRLMIQTAYDTPGAQDKPADKQPDKKSPFFDPRDEQDSKQEPKKASNLPPVTIVAFGNKIIITSEDPKAIAAIQGLVRLLVNTEAGPGDFEVVKLRYASAIDTAKLLDEAYNGKPQGGGGGGGKGQGGPGAMMQMMMNPLAALGGGSNQRPEVIRVVADPTTNSMLIRAKPIDMLTIRNLVYKYIDVAEPNALTIKTYYVQLKYANANSVAEIIERVYRESLSAKSVSTQASSGPGFSMFNQQRTTDPVADRHALLSFSADPSHNAVIVACPEALYKDIENLVFKLDEASRNINRVASIKDVDSVVVAQVLDGVFATSMIANQQRGGGGFQGGNNFGGGFGGNQGGGFRGNQGGGGFQGGGDFGGGGNFGGGGATPGIGRPTGGGGGGAPPGGGGGGKGGGKGLQSRGSDFFEDRVMDDPEFTNVFYDPSEEQEPPYDPVDAVLKASSYRVNPPYFQGLVHALAQDKDLGKEQGKEKQPEEKFLHPELKQAIDIFEQIRPALKDTEVVIEMVPVRWGDPTQITYTLSQLYTRVALPQRFNLLVSGLRGGVTTIALPNYILPPANVGGAAGALPQAPNVALYPQPRLGGILVATTRANMEGIKKEIQRLDQPLSDTVRPVMFALKNVEAGRVAVTINNFVQARFSPETINQNQIRITFDDHTNTVIVQAPPADMEQIRGLIEYIDTPENNNSELELRVVFLKNAVSDDLARLLATTIAGGTLTPTTTSIIGAQAAGGLGATGGQAGGGIGGIGGGAAAVAGQGVPGLGTTLNQIGGNTRAYKVKVRDKNGKSIEATVFYDIRINSDPRTNSLVISSPKGTMPFVLSVINQLDVPPVARSEIRVFTLKKTDATQMALTLQRLFLGTAGTATATTGGTGGVSLLGAGNTAAKPLQLTVSGGVTPDGAPIVDLRLTVDERTNSLILAGSKNDLVVADTVISTLEETYIPQQMFRAVRLRNQNAQDVANALTPFITAYLAVFTKDNQSTPFLDLQRNIVVQAEPISNSILLSATPEYFEKMVQVIAELDTSPPQVLVSVLVAEVTLNGQEELGVEIGLQSPVLFDRGVWPSSGVTYSTTNTSATSLVPTTGTNTNPFAVPGYAFNNPTAPLGNNPAIAPGQVGFQSLTNYGTGHVSQTSNVGGFVFSASSNIVNVLVRALKIQERIDVLSRPQLMALDNQTAYMNVGQNIPLNNGSNATATGVVSTAIIRQPIGVQLQVTPHITPDGRVIMRVIPEVSSISSTVFPVSPGVTSTSLTIQHVETTVSAADGETIIIGGMIQRRTDKTQTGVPWLGDLPGIGTLFRYRTESTFKTETIFIMTPHIVRNREEQEKVLTDEARRISWILRDVNRIHGTNNLGPAIMPTSMCDPIDPVSAYLSRQAPAPSLANPNPLPNISLERTVGDAVVERVPLAPARPGNPISTVVGDNYTVQYKPVANPAPRSVPAQQTVPYSQQSAPFAQPMQQTGPFGQPMQQTGPYTQPMQQQSAPFAQPMQQTGPFAQPMQQSSAPFAQPMQQTGPFTQPYALPAGSQWTAPAVRQQ